MWMGKANQIVVKMNKSKFLSKCPDDLDFICTVLIDEVELAGPHVRWNKLGMDYSEIKTPEDVVKVGFKVIWFINLALFIFD